MNHLSDTDTQVFFYERDFYVLSNFSAFQINIWGYNFPTAEHAYHYIKFRDKYPVIAEQVRWAKSAHIAFKIACDNTDKLPGGWNDVRVSLMKRILLRKVGEHIYVKKKLLATGDRELIEDSWRDDFWGWGPNKDGQNILGKLWMEIRGELRNK